MLILMFSLHMERPYGHKRLSDLDSSLSLYRGATILEAEKEARLEYPSLPMVTKRDFLATELGCFHLQMATAANVSCLVT